MANPQIAQFLNLLKKSRLLSASEEQVAQSVLNTKPASVDLFAKELVTSDLLTRWQADQLLKGQTGFVLQQYRLLSPVGRGGMGHVFRAKDDRTGAIVAIKVMSRKLTGNQTLVNRFRREIRASSLLNSRHIVRTLDAGRVGKVDFMVMEYVNGDQLDRIVTRVGSIPIAVACDIIRQAALGLQHAHERQMVHRDIKPGNLIVDWTADGLGVVKIMDMGLVRLESDEEERTVTRAGQVMGTPDYMSPEQGWDTATVDIRSDIYSLGCTFFRLLTGRVPFPGDNPLQVLMARCSRDCPSARTLRADIPEAIDAILRRMTLRDPSSRFQTPQEVAAALEPHGTPLSIEGLRMVMKEAGNDEAILLELESKADLNESQDAGYQQFLREMDSGAAVDLMISTNGGQGQAMSATMPILPQVDRRVAGPRKSVPQTSKTASVIGLASASTAVALGALFLFVNRDSGDKPVIDPEVQTIAEGTLPKAALVASSQQSVDPGRTLQYTPEFETPPNEGVPKDKLSFRLGRNAPDGVTVDASTGRIEWTVPIGQAPAAYPILIELVFAEGKVERVVTSTTVVANIQPLSMNFAFPRPEPRLVRADEAITVPFAVSPSPEPSLGLEYRLGSGSEAGMSIDAKTGQFSWIPSDDDFGRHMVSIELFDPKSSRALVSGELPVFVRPEITLPTFPMQKAEAGKTFELQLMPRPPRFLGKSLALRVDSGAPPGVELDVRRGMLRWKVPSDAKGRHEIHLILESMTPRLDFKPVETIIVVDVASAMITEPQPAISKEAITAKETELRELMKREIGGANTSSERAVLTRQLWNRMVDQTTSDSDAALLNIALEIADKGRVTDMALELNRLKAVRYQTSEIDGAVEIARNFRPASVGASQIDGVIENLVRLAFEAASAKRFDDIAALLGPCESLLKKAERGTLAKTLGADLENARTIAEDLAKAASPSDAKAQELSRILERWQFSKLFADPSSIGYVQSNETGQTMADGGRSLWEFDADRVTMSASNQQGSIGILDTSRDSGRYLIRMQVSSRSTAAMLIFGASREQNLNSWLLTIDNSEFGRIIRVPATTNVQDPVPSGSFQAGWNDLEVLVDGPEVRVRLNGVAAVSTRIADLQPGRFGFLVPLQRTSMPTLDIRSPRILTLPSQ